MFLLSQPYLRRPPTNAVMRQGHRRAITAPECLEPRLVLVTFTDIGINIDVSGVGNLSWGDFNNDGWVDFHSGGNVWKNDEGNLEIFQNLCCGEAVWGDFNNDGFLDLFEYGSGYRLYRNNGGNSFKDVSGMVPPLPNPIDKSRGAIWGDINNDGWVDIFLGGFEDGRGTNYVDVVLVNNGGTSFSISWTSPGAAKPTRGVTAADYDQDGDLDIYASAYRLVPNSFWQNDGLGNLTDVAAATNTIGTSNGYGGGHTIGSSIGDFNNDGLFDIFVANFSHHWETPYQPESQFLENLGPSAGYTFFNHGTGGISWQESFGSSAAGDFDNDGDLDLYFATAYLNDSSRLLQNNGSWNFSDATGTSRIPHITQTLRSAWADFDNDGDLDLGAGTTIFRNNGNSNNWLKIKLLGDGRLVNTAAIGASVRAMAGSQTILRQVEGGTGEGHQNDPTMHFGLGSYTGLVNLEISWPGGYTSTAQVASNQTHTINFVFVSPDPPEPLPVTNGLMLHLDASDIHNTGGATAPDDGDKVLRWRDVSGNNNHGITDASHAPTYSVMGGNGRPTVTFNSEAGAHQIVIPDSPSLDVGNNSFTVFVAVAFGDNGSVTQPQIIWEKRDGNSLAGHTLFLEHRNAGQTISGSTGMTIAVQVNDSDATNGTVLGLNSPVEGDLGMPTILENSDFHIYSVVFDRSTTDGDPAGTFFGIDNLAQLAGAPDTGIVTPPPLGNSQSSASMTIGYSPHQQQAVTNMQIGEIVLYNRELNTAEQFLVVEHLMRKYSLLDDRSWIRDTGGDWNSASNWTSSEAPNGSGIVTMLPDVISATRTIFTDTTITIGDLRIESANQYVIAGLGTVNFQSSTRDAHLEVIDGNHQFQTIVNLMSDLEINIATGSSLTFNNVLNLNGHTITKTGLGTLNVNNHLFVGGGSVNITSGVFEGNGTASGNVMNKGGIISPGGGSSSTGRLRIPRAALPSSASLPGKATAFHGSLRTPRAALGATGEVTISVSLSSRSGKVIFGELHSEVGLPVLPVNKREIVCSEVWGNASKRSWLQHVWYSNSGMTKCRYPDLDSVDVLDECFRTLDEAVALSNCDF